MAAAFNAAALILSVHFHLLILLLSPSAAQPGFISLDCGGAYNHTDAIGIQWTSDAAFVSGGGQTAQQLVQNGPQQLNTVRYFPADNRKYCYTMNVRNQTRYLVRATFLYGNFDNSVYPKFDISIGASPWSTIVVDDATTPIVEEAIILAAATTLSVCLSNGSMGQPFISTLELRQFNGSLYYTSDEMRFFLGLSARINFGAESNDSVRYPDDPFDRIWQSDSVRRANYLVDVAPGTERIATTKPIFVGINEEPPEKVMQTAVVGQDGSLNYRLDLEGFPANAWGVLYFAEIEDLAPNETRKFKLEVPGMPALSKPTVDVEENAQGKYIVYEPGYTNFSLPFVFSLGFRKTNDSSKGPILNALEIYKYVPITMGSQDANIMASMVSRYPQEGWTQEGGDPCLPTSWSWVQCSPEASPRVFSITLSGKNITGTIPVELTKLSGLVELKLDDNSFSGQIPDFSECHNLQSIHLENNQLTGELPSSLGDLPNLKELYVQNNKLSGRVPKALFKRSIILNFSGNSGLHMVSKKRRLCATLVSTLGVAIVVSAILFKVYRKRRLEARRNEIEWERLYGPPSFTYQDLYAATGGFKDKMLLGKGGFGSVFKGLLPHSKQTVAIKRISPESKQGMKEFMAEIIILGRLRHRNLVQLLGYCRQKEQLLLVYDYMPHGSLDFHLHTQGHNSTGLCWSQRFHILKCVASGIFYLHDECEQVVIHRDIKTSNVLLDDEMNARLGDFGLARSHDHGADAHTTRVAGTWGYIAPELARLGKATKATDVFALGVLMMEVTSGKRPIWVNNHGEPLALGDWVVEAWQRGSITHAVDPRLDDYLEEEIELVLKLGLLCSHSSPNARPCMRLVMQYLHRDAHLPSDLEPNSLLNIGSVQDEMHDQHAMSCPVTVITNLSKGR